MLEVLFIVPQSDRSVSMPFIGRLLAAVEPGRMTVDQIPVRKTFRPWKVLADILRVRRAVRAKRYDVVNAQYGTYAGFVTVLGAKGRVPIVVTFRGSDLNPTPGQSYWIQHLLSQFSALCADGVICVSRPLAKRIWARKRLVEIVPSPTDLERFAPLPRDEARERLGWPKDRAIALFVAGTVPLLKRLDLALAVDGELKRSGSPVELFVLRELVSEERLALHLNAADALLFLSDFEGSPNLVREACACNLPVVTVPVADVAEVLSGVDDCAIVERSIPAIARELERIAAKRVRSNARGKMARYGASVLAARTVAFYTNVLGGKRVRHSRNRQFEYR